MSLMDRLSGRKSPNGTGAQAPAALPSSPPEGIKPPTTPQPAQPTNDSVPLAQ